MTQTLTRLGVVLALAAALAVHPGAAVAEAPPGNDTIAGATPVAVPGGVEDQDTTGATASSTDPSVCWNPEHYTVWYRAVAPETGTLRVAAFASLVFTEEPGDLPRTRDLNSGVAVFTGAPGALVPLGCSTLVFGEGEPVDVQVQAGDVLHIVASGLQPSSDGTRMTLTVRPVRAPQVEVTVHKRGSVDPDGVATVFGTLRCDVDTTARVSLALRQRSRDAVSSAMTTPCTTSSSRWSLTFASGVGAAALHPGRAAVEGAVIAGDEAPVTEVTVSTSVRLRPAVAGC